MQGGSGVREVRVGHFDGPPSVRIPPCRAHQVLLELALLGRAQLHRATGECVCVLIRYINKMRHSVLYGFLFSLHYIFV
jgi:hypothetical protein